MNFTQSVSKPRYLCRWWMKTRVVDKSTECFEFYCPMWAKPLDFIWKLVFGKPKLIKTMKLNETESTDLS